MNNSHPILMLHHISKSYPEGTGARLHILKDTTFTLHRGECVALLGPSGSGKSTLLHISGLLDIPDHGEIWIEDKNTQTLKDTERTALRREKMGFIYQFHHLLPEFTAIENVKMPCLLNDLSEKESDHRARELLTHLGISHRLNHAPSQLSGGEQQRVAIARALVHAPRLLLADEPTGNLDPLTSNLVFDALIHIVRESRLAALIATHNLALAEKMDRIVQLVDGKLIEVPSSRTPINV